MIGQIDKMNRFDILVRRVRKDFAEGKTNEKETDITDHNFDYCILFPADGFAVCGRNDSEIAAGQQYNKSGGCSLVFAGDSYNRRIR